MAKLIITRKRGLIGCLQTHNIWLDSEVIATIKNNTTIELEISPGTHKIQTGASWFDGISAIKTFKISHGQTIKFLIFRPILANIALLLTSFSLLSTIIAVAAATRLTFPMNYIIMLLMFMLTVLFGIATVKLAIGIKRVE